MLDVFNDTHCGAIRSAGTTPRTQWELRQWNLELFSTLLNSSDNDIMYLGDLFDTFSVPLSDFWGVYRLLDNWLARHPNRKMYLVAGNHDLSKTSTTMSSFHLLGGILSQHHAGVQVITEPCGIRYGYVIPHLPNQDLFDAALANVPACDNLFLHCNYDNNFAAQSDQSLNLTAAQAAALPVEYIVIAHEHQTRTIGKKVFIPGNQIPTSVADWLGTDMKRFVQIDRGCAPSLVPCLEPTGIFERVDWREPEMVVAKFIRLEGSASAEEAQEVIETVARYRQQSQALVVTNAVRIQAGDSASSFADSLETIKAFDVLAALKELLEEREFNLVQEALGK